MNKEKEKDQEQPVTFNVGGTLFSILPSTLKVYPQTKLARQLEWGTNEFIDRDPQLFPIILNFYRTTQLHIPPCLSKSAVRAELDYFNIPYEEEVFINMNIGQSWLETTYDTVYNEICCFFDTMFQSAWFQDIKRKQLEICWMVGPSLDPTHTNPSALFFLETNQQLALVILRKHFGIN